MQQFDSQIPDSQILDEQIAYYRARASEYDEWFMRQGRYNHGDAHTRQWFVEVEEIRQALALFNPTGNVLEIASGTGWWTEQLVRYADTIVAVDAAMETIELNTQRLQAAQVPAEKVKYVHTNIFEWNQDHAADGQFDAAFFSFWLSHVPPEQFDEFWANAGDITYQWSEEGQPTFVINARGEYSTQQDGGDLRAAHHVAE